VVSVYHAFSFSPLEYLIPAFLVTVPFLTRKRISLRFRAKDILQGMIASAAILIPFGLVMSYSGRSFSFLPANTLLFQLVGVSFAEEIYFRGFLQESIGNTIRGVVIASALFSFVHVPQLIIHNDINAMLTFFPSLVMGFLYMRTGNIAASTIFHFLANTMYLGFR
jgi:membrane protease YdiL (CAAX protease family)